MFGLACDAVGRLRLDSFDMTEPHVQIRSDVDDSAVTDNAVSVVGLSAMGMSELGATAVAVLRDADVILGSWRQLNLLSDDITAERRPWGIVGEEDSGVGQWGSHVSWYWFDVAS